MDAVDFSKRLKPLKCNRCKEPDTFQPLYSSEDFILYLKCRNCNTIWQSGISIEYDIEELNHIVHTFTEQ